MTKSIKYVFSRILEIFAYDLKENLIFVITFADAAEPQAAQLLISSDSPFKSLIE
jgi:hypothetical protein